MTQLKRPLAAVVLIVAAVASLANGPGESSATDETRFELTLQPGEGAGGSFNAVGTGSELTLSATMSALPTDAAAETDSGDSGGTDGIEIVFDDDPPVVIAADGTVETSPTYRTSQSSMITRMSITNFSSESVVVAVDASARVSGDNEDPTVELTWFPDE